MDTSGQEIQPCVPGTKLVCQRRCRACKKLPSVPDGISLHRFPNPSTDKKRFRAWCKAMALPKEASPSSVLCSNHFSIEQFFVMKRSDQSRLMLQTNAIPNINLPGGPQTACGRERWPEEKPAVIVPDLNETIKFLKPPKPPPPAPPTQRDRELDEELYVCVTVVRK